MTDTKKPAEGKINIDAVETKGVDEKSDPLAIPGACIELPGWPIYDSNAGFAHLGKDRTAHDYACPPISIDGTGRHAMDEYVLNHLPLSEDQKQALIKRLLLDANREKGLIRKDKEEKKNKHLSKTTAKKRAHAVRRAHTPLSKSELIPGQEAPSVSARNYKIILRSSRQGQSKTIA